MHFKDFLVIILFVLLIIALIRRLAINLTVSVRSPKRSTTFLRFIASIKMDLNEGFDPIRTDGIVVGILVSPESDLNYTFRSLDSILGDKTAFRGNNPSIVPQFVVQVTSIDNYEAALKIKDLLQSRYRELDDGKQLHYLVPPLELYMFDTEFDFSQGRDSEYNECTRLRSLDLLYLMLNCHLRGRYFLQLTTDVSAPKDYLIKLKGIISDHSHSDWLEIKLAGIPLAAALYQSREVVPFADYAIHHLFAGGCSGLMDQYFQDLYEECVSKATNIRSCLEWVEQGQITVTPSLFFPNKITSNDQKAVVGHNYLATQRRHVNYTFDSNIPVRYEYWPFEEIPIYINPPAMIATAAVSGSSCTVAALYRFQCKYSHLRVVSGGLVKISFYPPVKLAEFYLRSGRNDYPDSKFPRSVSVYVIPFWNSSSATESLAQPVATVRQNSSNSFKHMIFITRFDRRGIAQAPLGRAFGEIHELQIRFREPSKKWLVLRDIVIKRNIVSDEKVLCCEELWPDSYPSGIPGYDP